MLVKYFAIMLILLSTIYGVDNILEQEYVESNFEQLYEEFEYFSDTESMECNNFTNPSKCYFKVDLGYNLVSTILILSIAFLLMISFIGPPSQGIGFSDAVILNVELNKEKAKEINQRPFQLGKAILVLVIALYLIKYINSGYYDKNFDFDKKIFYLTDGKTNEIIESFSFDKIKNIELLKYKKDSYEHYELNLHLVNDKRIHIFARRDDLSATIYSKILSEKMSKPIEKLLSSKP